MQLRDLEAYAKARGWTVRDKFVDEGISGSQTKRPALDRLLSACRRRQVDVVLVWRLDRLVCEPEIPEPITLRKSPATAFASPVQYLFEDALVGLLGLLCLIP